MKKENNWKEELLKMKSLIGIDQTELIDFIHAQIQQAKEEAVADTLMNTKSITTKYEIPKTIVDLITSKAKS